ncbi:diguanylate cyclase domain-containing protein [Paenibacillus turpanensis]|uniref:diguanylate cyclase domain-containing protein n=1 Tax=Paenibacillus turpanensis TaxID=2689078 RepID=UPI00140E2C2D
MNRKEYLFAWSPEELNRRSVQWGAGFVMGLLGAVLMLFSIRVSPEVILDLRHVAILLAAAFFGGWASVISSLMIGAARIVLFWQWDAVSYRAAASMVLIGLLCAWIRPWINRRLPRYLAMNVGASLILFAVLYINVSDHSEFATLYVYHFSFSVIGSLLGYAAMSYMIRSNRSFYVLSQRTSQLRALLGNLNSGVLVEDIHRRILHSNAKLAEMLGIPYSPAQLEGMDGRRLLRETSDLVEDEGRFTASIDKLVRERAKRLNEEVLLKDGRTFETDYIPIYDGISLVGHLWNIRDITIRKQTMRKLEEANKRLESLSHRDGLTDIPNRRAYDERLEQEWASSQRKKEPLSLLLIDIDQFKLYNDTYGHQAGDECLRAVARELQAQCKRPADFAARYGGEEFAVLLPDTDAGGALRVAEQIRQEVYKLGIPHSLSSAGGYVSVSIGACTRIASPDERPALLFELADQALYEAKKNGRNRVVQAMGS